MITIEGISKTFGRKKALLPLDLEIPAGGLWGLLGHNGAGKSTLIGILLGQIHASSGRVYIDGADVFRQRKRALRRVGAIFETPGFCDYLSGLNNLRLFCGYTAPAPPERYHEVLELTRLRAALQDPVKTYSCGMRQRLALAQALLPDPSLLLLDEPGSGLDPEGFQEMRAALLRLHRDHGMTILFSSHLLSEVEQLCTHVAVLREGRLVYAGPWKQESDTLLRIATDRQREAETYLLQKGLAGDFPDPGAAHLQQGIQPADVAAALVQAGFRLHSLTPVATSLEAFYLRLNRRLEKNAHETAPPPA